MTANSAFLGTLYAQLAVNTASLDHAVAKMKSMEAVTNASLTRIQQRYQKLGGEMKSFGRSMTQFVTLPMALIGGAAFKMYKDFEFSMNKIVSLVGVPREQMEAWKKEILALAPAVGKAPKELADAMYFITSAGIRGKEAMEILEESAKSSAGGLGEVKVIADLITSAMNAYGKESLSAAQANDVLVATVREGKAEADLLAQSMGLVLPIASAMGASFAQVGAATAAMTRTGTKAATAAIQLRQIFNSLLKPAKEAEQALIDMKTSSAELRSIVREEGLLAALLKLKQITEEYGIAALGKVIPNIRSLTGVLDITGKNLEENIKLFKAIENSLGDAGKMFGETANTVEFKFNVAIAGIKTALTKFGESISSVILPMLTRFSSFIQNVSNRFESMNPTVKSLIVRFGGLLLALGPVITIMGFMYGNVVPGLMMILKRLNKVTIATSAGFVRLNAVILANPLVALGVAVAAAAAYLFIYTKRVRAAAEAQDEFNKRGLEVSDEEIKRIAKMGENARQVQYEIASAAKNEGELQKTFGKTLSLLDDISKTAERTISLPGLNKRQVEESIEQIKTLKARIDDELILLEEVDYTIEVELDIKLKEVRAEDTKALQSAMDSLYSSLEQPTGLQDWFGKGGLDVDTLAKPYVNLAYKQKASLDDMSLNSEAFLDSLAVTNFKIIDLTKNDADKLIYQKQKENDSYAKALKDREKDLTTMEDAHVDSAKKIADADKIAADLLTSGAIKDTLEKEVEFAENMQTIFGKSFDYVTHVLSANQQALEAYLRMGISPLDERIVKLSKSVRELEAELSMRGLKIFAEDSAKVYEELQKMQEIEFDALSTAALGEMQKEAVKLSEGIDQLVLSFYGLDNASKKAMQSLEGAISRIAEYAAAGLIGESNAVLETFMLWRDAYNSAFASGAPLNTILELKKGMDAAFDDLNVFQKLELFVKDNEEQVKMIVQNFAKLWSGIGSLIEANMAKEIAAMEKVAKQKNKSTEWVEKERERIESKYSKKRKAMMVAEAIAGTALAIVNALLTKPFLPMGLIAAGLAAAAGAVQIAAIQAAPMAQGGMVPPGYPNDSFPALLTSGERVIPARASRQDQMGGEVVFRIEGDELVGILKKRESVAQNY